MSLRLLHTADWQLGKPFHNLPTEVAPLAARGSVRGSADDRRACHASTRPRPFWSPATSSTATSCPSASSSRRWRPCAASPAPGCSCPAITTRRWPKGFGAGWSGWAGRPTCFVAAAPTPITLADGRLVVLPAPLTERHTADDLTAWMDAAATPSGARCGSALPTARSPAACRTAADAANPIDPRAGDRGPARLSGAGRLARHARDRPAHLVCGHARARPLSRQRCRQRAAGRAGRARRAARGDAPAHGASRAGAS